MTDAPLVGAITLIRTLPCLADPGKIIVIGETDAAIDGVLPLLNAILPTVVSYHPFTGVMTLRRRPGLITLYPGQGDDHPGGRCGGRAGAAGRDARSAQPYLGAAG